MDIALCVIMLVAIAVLVVVSVLNGKQQKKLNLIKEEREYIQMEYYRYFLDYLEKREKGGEN